MQLWLNRLPKHSQSGLPEAPQFQHRARCRSTTSGLRFSFGGAGGGGTYFSGGGAGGGTNATVFMPCSPRSRARRAAASAVVMSDLIHHHDIHSLMRFALWLVP